MSKIRKMATIFAKEMVEHYIENGVMHLDIDYIAEKSCELAYKIDQKVSSYEGKEPMTEKDVAKAVKKALESTPQPSIVHHV